MYPISIAPDYLDLGFNAISTNTEINLKGKDTLSSVDGIIRRTQVSKRLEYLDIDPTVDDITLGKYKRGRTSYGVWNYTLKVFNNIFYEVPDWPYYICRFNRFIERETNHKYMGIRRLDIAFDSCHYFEKYLSRYIVPMFLTANANFKNSFKGKPQIEAPYYFKNKRQAAFQYIGFNSQKSPIAQGFYFHPASLEGKKSKKPRHVICFYPKSLFDTPIEKHEELELPPTNKSKTYINNFWEREKLDFTNSTVWRMEMRIFARDRGYLDYDLSRLNTPSYLMEIATDIFKKYTDVRRTNIGYKHPGTPIYPFPVKFLQASKT